MSRIIIGTVTAENKTIRVSEYHLRRLLGLLVRIGTIKEAGFNGNSLVIKFESAKFKQHTVKI